MDKETIGLAIFKQICEVNELDEQQVRAAAQETSNSAKGKSSEAEHLIRTAFHQKAMRLVQDLELNSGAGTQAIKEGEEYTIIADPAAPSFTVNEDLIQSKYSKEDADKLIDALGQVMLPVRA